MIMKKNNSANQITTSLFLIKIKDSYMPAKRTELRFEFSLSSPKASDLSSITF